MRLKELTTTVLAVALALASASTLSAQTRRESRPSHSTSGTSRSTSGTTRSSSSTRPQTDRTKQQSAAKSSSDKKQPASARPQSSASRLPSPSQQGPRPQGNVSSGNASTSTASRRPSPAQEPRRPDNVNQQAPNQGGQAPGKPSGNKPGPAPGGYKPGSAPDGHKPGSAPGGHKPGHIGQGGHGGPHVPPRDRRPISHKNPSRFFDHGRHYYGYRVNKLPASYHIDIFWGQKYYICDGVYYRLYDGTYYVCRPPYGYTFAYDAYAYSPVVCSFAYYSLYDRQFNIINQNYAIIAQQNSEIARNNATIAAQNDQIQQNAAQNAQRSSESYILATRLGLVQSYAAVGTEYYYDDGVFFVKGSSGGYETILPPAGALIEALPDDYSEVTLSDGNEYYLVDDTVYRLILDSGKPYFEVLGQIQN